MDADDKSKIDETLSEIEERARARRKRMTILTFAPVILTGCIVLVLAREVASKRADLQLLEGKARDLEQKVGEKQKEREQLESENKQLEERKKSLQRFIEGLHERRERAVFPPKAGSPELEKAPESVVISDLADAPFIPLPEVVVEPRLGDKGRDVFDVTLSIGPENQLGSVERVTYDLNQDWYQENHFESTQEPPFQVKFSVYECMGTVLVTVKPKSGESTQVALDWCKNDVWPKPAQTISAPAPKDEPQKGPGRPNRPPVDTRPPPKTDSPTRPPK